MTYFEQICDYNGDKYNGHDCAPGDLSGRYGSMDLSTSATQLYDVSGYDPLMKPLDQLTGKSVALLYTSDKFIIAWAVFEIYWSNNE